MTSPFLFIPNKTQTPVTSSERGWILILEALPDRLGEPLFLCLITLNKLLLSPRTGYKAGQAIDFTGWNDLPYRKTKGVRTCRAIV